MTSIEWIFEKLWDEPKDKLTWHSILIQAKEMHYKEIMGSMEKGMELQEKENNRIGFRERNGLLPQQEISDEEIDNAVVKEYENVGDEKLFPNHTDKDIWMNGFYDGARWYREQLKQK